MKKFHETSGPDNISAIVIVSAGHYYLAPGGGCEVLFSPGLSVWLCVCVSVQYCGILFFGY